MSQWQLLRAEPYFRDFLYRSSPIHVESGSIGGLFHPVTELTQQPLTERRLNISEVGILGSTGSAQSIQLLFAA